MSLDDKDRQEKQSSEIKEEKNQEVHMSDDIEEVHVDSDEKKGSPQEEEIDWKKQAEEFHGKYLKALADLENYRRRTRRDREELVKYAAGPLLEKLLPVVDNLERALSASKETGQEEALHQGVDIIYRQLMQVLSESGLTPIESVGQPFDPHVHNAVGQVESDKYESGIVVEELQKGYRFKDRVLRPAMVQVSI